MSRGRRPEPFSEYLSWSATQGLPFTGLRMESEPVDLEENSALAGALGAWTAQSSRGLLTTILGEFVLPTNGGAWTQTLVAALDLVGIREKAARQTIARMQDQGWLDRTRVGRQTRWELTPATRDLLERGASRIYGFAQAPQRWDGRWVVLLASVPEADRSSRYRMTVGLRWAGFGSVGQGVWLSPWSDQEDAAVNALAALDVNATSFIASLGQLGDGTKLAAQAWDLPVLRSRYESFLQDTEPLAAGEHALTTDGAQALAALTRLVHRWRQFPFIDPDLPLELLAPDWPGTAAAKRFSELRARLLPSATEWWSTTESTFTPARRSGAVDR